MDTNPDSSQHDQSVNPSIESRAEPPNTGWGMDFEVAVCEGCDWSYLMPAGSLPQTCPHCFQIRLTPVGEQLQELPYIKPPELSLPFTLLTGQLAQSIESFARGIPFAPGDLNPKTLQSRLRRIYLPMWLVDAQVRATWQAEAGFDYQVVSHQDQYQDYGGWSSRQVKEGRVRWEPRLGRLDRAYNNIPVPALGEEGRIQSALGAYALDDARPYLPETLSGSFVRLPNRTPEDSWSDAKPAIQQSAAEECGDAASADHIRSFRWSPEFASQNWTLLLLPVYASYYQDDEGKPQPVLLHGRTGRLSGARRASLKRAQSTALSMLAAALVFGLIAMLILLVGIAMPALLAIGVIVLVFALLVGLGAIYPLAAVWWFNRQERPGQI